MSIRGLSILVVEDEPLIAMDIIATLEAHDVKVLGPLRSLGDVDRFLREARAVPPCDVVVLDYELVDGTSGELARRLVEFGISLVLHTASPELVKPLADELGVALVPKPAFEGDLVTGIRFAAVKRTTADILKASQSRIL